MTAAAPRALLAGGDDRSMLATARSFEAAGAPFFVSGVRRRGMVGVSRSVRGRVLPVGPSARREPEAYARFLAELVREHGIDLVIPLSDSTLRACDLGRQALEPRTKLAMAPSRAVRNVLDKRANLETARSLGIPCPAQFELERVEQVPELVTTLGFPLVLKDPGPSTEGDRPRPAFSWLVARDPDELNGHLATYCADGAFPIFQELRTGVVHNVCCFAVRGEIVAAHEYRGLRRLRGLSVLREISPLTPELLDYCRRMLGRLEWEGVAQLAFFVSGRGDVGYMETNGRFWASLEGSIAAGWDFPLWTYGYFARGEVPEPPPPSQGVGLRWRWHYGALELLMRHLVGRPEATRAGIGRARALADYAAGFGPGVHADVFRLADPLPELVDHWRGAKPAALTGLQALGRRVGR